MTLKSGTLPKSVALYGFASATREGVWQSQADEIWSVVWAYNYNIPRLDRLFEMHPVWLQAKSQKPEFQKARDHWAWLQANTSIPVYMLELRPEVPQAVRYPIEGVSELVPPSRRRKVFTSSFDYLMALAIYEGYQRIECYGFEMGSDTEYRYQREGAAYWIAQCDARGIELVLPDKTALLKNKLYGYEGGSMIYRQDLERMKGVREQQKIEAFARVTHLEGQLAQTSMIWQNAKWKKLAAERDKQYRIALVTAGALQECEYLLKEIDLEEPDDTLFDPVRQVVMEA